VSRILIIGGAGFLGSNLTESLLKDGHEITILDQTKSGRLFSSSPVGSLTCLIGNTADRELIRNAVDGQEFVCHLASSTIPSTSNDDPKFDIASNLTAAIEILDACRDFGIKKTIFLSSGGTVYGNTSVPLISENHPTNPVSSYGIVKLAIEKYLHLYNHLYGSPFVALRLSNPYGKFQSSKGTQGAISVFLDRASKNIPIDVWGNGEIVRDYIHVSDVVTGIQACMSQECESGIYNLGGGVGYSLNDIVREIGSVLGKNPLVNFHAGRPSDVERNVLDVTKLKKALSWQPTIDLKTGIIMTYQYNIMNNEDTTVFSS
jgi:UDP-glucose 4-epimerase